MKPQKSEQVSESEASGAEIDFSDLLGINQAFLARPDAERQVALIDAHCNKVGSEQNPGVSSLD
jgi:hypothetical protein